MISHAAMSAMQGDTDSVDERPVFAEAIEQHISEKGKQLLSDLEETIQREGVDVEVRELVLKGKGVTFVTYVGRDIRGGLSDPSLVAHQTVEFVGTDGEVARSDIDGFNVDKAELHVSILNARDLAEVRVETPTVIICKKTVEPVNQPAQVSYVVQAINVEEAKDLIGTA